MKLPSEISRTSIGSASPLHFERISLLFFFGLLLAVVSPMLAVDGELAVPTTPSGDAVAATIEASNDALELPLDRAIVLALRHNIGLVVQRYGRERSLLGIDAAQGIYDLNLTADLRTSTSSSPQTSSLQETQGVLSDENDRWNFSLSQLTSWGGGLQFNSNNRSQETSDRTQLINPLYNADASLFFQQPLLRNFGRDATNRNIIVARKDSAISLEAFRSNVESVVRQVSDIYWDLVAAQEQLDVSQESLELARELHEMNRIQVEVGTLAPLEMVQSEAGVAAREEEIIRQQAAVEDAADGLRRLLNLEVGNLWDVPIQPVTDPEIDHEPIDLKQAVDLALEHRADVIQQRLEIEKRELDARIAQRNKLPQVDLTAGIGYNGTNVTIDREAGTLIDDGYSGALQQITDRDFEFWSVQFNVSYPIQNRDAKARAAQAELFLEQGEWALRDLENSVLVEVRRTARAVDTAAKSIESARVSSKLARKNLEAEQKRYENGLSTSFTVLQIQEDLSEALSREVSAVIGYRKALAAYQLSIGRLLDEFGVTLDDPTSDD
ncbi:MAG: TolC family protein [Thermoanaerobaculia bacterium]|nr:TolC family protein [Thermoanaerobaculia bacterium]